MPERPRSEPKYEFIDAARGVAILLVLICHTAVSQQPWPMRRFTELGWHGVQLFFVVSSMTLALSWQYRRGGRARVETCCWTWDRLRKGPSSRNSSSGCKEWVSG